MQSSTLELIAPGAGLWLVWLLAPLAALSATRLLARMSEARPRRGLGWLAAAAIALGTGVWSVQVTVIAARQLPQAAGFSATPLVLLAWAVAVLACLAAVVLFAGQCGVRGAMRVPAAALVLGCGVVAAHLATVAAVGVGVLTDGRLAKLLPAALLLMAGTALPLAIIDRILPRTTRQLVLRDGSAALLWSFAQVAGAHMMAGSAGLADPGPAVPAGGGLPAGAVASLVSIGSLLLLSALLGLTAVDARLRASLRKDREELARHSLRDGLTKLPSRVRFEGTLAQAVRRADERGSRLAVLVLNIDGFKYINQAGGHGGGDRYLCEVARRLRRVAPLHMLARIGGDEFVALLPDNPHRGASAALAGRLLRAVRKPFELNGQDFVATGSIGIAMYPDDGALQALISHAVMAMRDCKDKGGGSYCFFEARMLNGANEQGELLRDLRQALRRGQFELYYQPKVHAPTGEITGAEALLRWNHPKRGLVSPAVFVPIAERYGLIGAIGDWVIDQACRQAAEWREKGLHMRVAINLSPYQLREPSLGQRIGTALQRHQVNPKRLTCEITESVAMQDSEATARFFAALAEVGVHISIDDFGTGYSGLTYLRKLPAEELKIDRSFVCDLETNADARTVVEAVVKLGRALNMNVVAEGVETEGQNRILSELGCHQLQGFLFAKPMSAKALALWAMDDQGPRAIAFRSSLFKPTAVGA